MDDNSTDHGKVTGMALWWQLRSPDLTVYRESYVATVESHAMDEILSLMVHLIDTR